jgi:hypothetical protein
MLKYKVEYDPLSVNEYQKQYEEQQIKYMKKTSRQTGLSIAACPGLKRDQTKERRPPVENALFGLRVRPCTG